ncbi:hypothetical protein ACFXJ6_04965 [Streptomyces sp. NPDC059218]|uniref:hypothetical protein n=1 Tax=unclassified Streptomyces TaxID=2593676 RepID=UPI003697DED3
MSNAGGKRTAAGVSGAGAVRRWVDKLTAAFVAEGDEFCVETPSVGCRMNRPKACPRRNCAGAVSERAHRHAPPRDQLAEGLACAEACREGPAFHQARACSELRPADLGEQGGAGDVDARVHERRTDAFGEWFLDCLKGRDVTLCSRNFAPDGPFYEFLP